MRRGEGGGRKGKIDASAMVRAGGDEKGGG